MKVPGLLEEESGSEEETSEGEEGCGPGGEGGDRLKECGKGEESTGPDPIDRHAVSGLDPSALFDRIRIDDRTLRVAGTDGRTEENTGCSVECADSSVHVGGREKPSTPPPSCSREHLNLEQAHAVCEGPQLPPGRDDGGSDGSTDVEEDGDHVSITSGVSVTSSYLHGEQGQAEVRRLVYRSLVKKQKVQQRQTRSKKEANRVAAGGQKREKRTAHKVKIKESLDVGFF